MVFTSGTRRHLQGALLTHANCFWNNLALSRTVEITSSDVVLSVLPQFHVGRLEHPAAAGLVDGRDRGAGAHLRRPGACSRLIAGPADHHDDGRARQLPLLAEHPGFAAADLSSLRHAVVGGAPMPRTAAARLAPAWRRRSPRATASPRPAPNVLCLPEDARATASARHGVPYPHVEVAVADPVTGEHLDGPATGELLVRGPSVFAGLLPGPGGDRAAPSRAAGCTPATWWSATPTGTTAWSTGSRTSSSPAARTWPRPRSKQVARAGIPRWPTPPWSGVPDDRWGEMGHAFVVPRGG